MMTVILALVVISLIVLAHELGHFLAARAFGIEVQEFAIGFGPKIAGFRGKEQVFHVRGHEPEIITAPGTEYNLRAFPLGGFVRMSGMEPGDEGNPIGFNAKNPFQKMAVSFLGPFFNLLLAVVVFIYAYTFVGVPYPVQKAVIGEIIPGKPAAQAGLLAGDRITSINGKAIKNWSQMVTAIADNPKGKALRLTVDRGGKTLSFKVTPKMDTDNKPKIGIVGQYYQKKVGVGKAVKFGFIEAYQRTVYTVKSFGWIFTGKVSTNEISGPVGIARIIGQAAQAGLLTFLSLLAWLSISLGVMNLLPIPALDGSRIIFAALEAVRRRPVEPERENFIHLVGFVLLMGLIILVTFNDIYKWVTGPG